MIAEGLVPYLTETDVRRLLTSVVDAFPPAKRRMYRLMNLLPGMKRVTRIVRFRF